VSTKTAEEKEKIYSGFAAPYKEELEKALLRISGENRVVKSPQDAGKFYEAFVLVRLLQAICSNDYVWNVLDEEGEVSAKPLVLRGAPGFLNDAKNKAGSIQFNVNGDFAEIINGVRWLGESGSDHEIDIGIVPKRQVDRRSEGAIKADILLSVECKARTGKNVTLGPKMGRELIGYAIEFPDSIFVLVTNISNAEEQIKKVISKSSSLTGHEKARVAECNKNGNGCKAMNTIILSRLQGNEAIFYLNGFQENSRFHGELAGKFRERIVHCLGDR